MQFQRLTQSSEIEELLSFHNEKSRSLVIDVETSNVDPRKAELFDVQITGYTEDQAVVFSKDWVHLLLRLKPEVILVAHNYKYDAHVLYRHGIDLLSRTWRDTLLIGHLLDENRESYSLDSYVKEYWNDPYKEEFWAKYKSYQEAPEEEKLPYSCKDIVYTGLLFRKHENALLSNIPESLVEHVHRLQHSLLRTEIEGLKVDLPYLTDLGVKLKHRIDELEPEMRGCVKEEIKFIELEAWSRALDLRKTDKGKAGVPRPTFSFQSTAQLQELLYRKLGLSVQRNEKTRATSTDFDSLEKIKKEHPIVELIQENRELQKVYTAYVTGTIDRLDNERIYPSFRVSGTVTGRISHSNPNLAQLPKKGGIRGIYVPDPGRVFISADYDQLEVILEANLTGDKNLIRMLENGESKHDLTARELGCDRDTAKTLNFAHQYWCSHFKTAKLLNISVNEGLNVWRKYWDIYAGPKQLKEKTDKAVNDGEVLQTMFGRKRRFPIRKRAVWDKDYRMAYNFMIQSPGADITSRAFYLISEHLKETGTGRGLYTVHDEVMAEVVSEYAEVVEPVILDYMESIGRELGFKVPLKAKGSGPMSRWED